MGATRPAAGARARTAPTLGLVNCELELTFHDVMIARLSDTVGQYGSGWLNRRTL